MRAVKSGADLVLFAIAATMYTLVWRVQDLYPALGLLRPAMLTLGLALAVLAMDRHPARAVSRIRSPILGWMLALHGLVLLGIPGSLAPDVSLGFFVIELVPRLLFTLAIVAAVRGVRDVEWLAFANLVGAFLFTLVVYVRFDVRADGRW
jgi:hypothetical protein